MRKTLAVLAVVTTCGIYGADAVAAGQVQNSFQDGHLPNNVPFVNPAGTAATFSTAGVDLNNLFHVPQGSNGRSCESCHLVQAGWSIRPIDVEILFFLSQGTDAIFNRLDANSPAPTWRRPRLVTRRSACCARACSVAVERSRQR